MQAQPHRSIWPHASLAESDKEKASKFGESIAYSVKAGTQNRHVQKGTQEIAAKKAVQSIIEVHWLIAPVFMPS